MRLFAKGDMVEVFSARYGWLPDGQVVEVTTEGGRRDNAEVVAGSMKVIYDNECRFKWVSPPEMGELLRASPRPQPPLLMAETLSVERCGWLMVQWVKRHCELKKGYLQCWTDEGESRSAKPLATLCLLGVEITCDGMLIKLRDPSGVVHTIAAASERQAVAWVKALRAHTEYCQSVRAFMQNENAEAEVDRAFSDGTMPESSYFQASSPSESFDKGCTEISRRMALGGA